MPHFNTTRWMQYPMMHTTVQYCTNGGHTQSPGLTTASASIWCRRMGLLANSTSGLGLERVRGRSLVPNPPTRIKAFMMYLKLTLHHVLRFIYRSRVAGVSLRPRIPSITIYAHHIYFFRRKTSERTCFLAISVGMRKFAALHVLCRVMAVTVL